MTNKLQELPRSWLHLGLCEKLYKAIKQNHYLEFDEPLPEFSTRFLGRLESILGSVSQSFSGKHLNKNILQAAVAYFYQIAEGHAFANGNKRMAVLFTHAFLLVNDTTLTVTHEDLYKTAVDVVELSRTMTANKIKAQLAIYFSKVLRELTLDDINSLLKADDPKV